MGRRSKTPMKRRVGYKLRVLPAQRGKEAPSWIDVGLFQSRYEAEEYCKRYYPTATRYTLQGVRVDYTPLPASEGRRDKVELGA